MYIYVVVIVLQISVYISIFCSPNTYPIISILYFLILFIFSLSLYVLFFFFFQAEDGIRDGRVTGVQTCALPISLLEPSLLVPLAVVLAYEMGWAVFRSTGLAVAVVVAQVGFRAFPQGHGGVYPDLWQPGQAATQLLLPAVVVAFFVLVRRPSWPVGLTLAAGSADLALVHPTYALFLAIPLIAFVAVQVLFTRGEDLRREILALVSLGLPMALAYLWLRPIV